MFIPSIKHESHEVKSPHSIKGSKGMAPFLSKIVLWRSPILNLSINLIPLATETQPPSAVSSTVSSCQPYKLKRFKRQVKPLLKK